MSAAQQTVPTYLEALDERQTQYATLVSQGFGRREAARISGYPARIVRQRDRIETPELKARMQQALRKEGAGLRKLARVAAESMDATVVARGPGFATLTDIPDHKTRAVGAKLAGDLWGLTERDSAAGATVAVQINLGSGPLAELLAAKLSPSE